MKNLTLLAFAFILVLSSCSIEKRHYMKGFHVSSHSKKHKLKEQPETDIVIVDTTIENLTASNDLPTPIIIDKPTTEEPCDVIILRNGEEISCKVNEIGLSEIKYKKCNNVNGPTISVKKDDVFIIKYANGTKDVFSKTESEEKKKSSTYSDENEPEKQDKKVNWFAVAGFILSVLAVLVSIFTMGLGIVVAVMGIVFSSIGLVKINRNAGVYKGRGFAVWGLVLGIVTVVLCIALITFLLALLAIA